jgi:hypothetical protein
MSYPTRLERGTENVMVGIRNAVGLSALIVSFFFALGYYVYPFIKTLVS